MMNMINLHQQVMSTGVLVRLERLKTHNSYETSPDFLTPTRVSAR